MHIARISAYFAVAAIAAGLVFVACSSELAREPGRYYSTAEGFSIKFHTGWVVMEGDGIESASPPSRRIDISL